MSQGNDSPQDNDREGAADVRVEAQRLRSVHDLDHPGFAPESGDKPDAEEQAREAIGDGRSDRPSPSRVGDGAPRAQEDDVGSAPESGEKPQAS